MSDCWKSGSRSEQDAALVTFGTGITGADELVRLPENRAVSLAMGHSNATFEQARSAVERGFSYAVHTFMLCAHSNTGDRELWVKYWRRSHPSRRSSRMVSIVDPAVVRLSGARRERARAACE